MDEEVNYHIRDLVNLCFRVDFATSEMLWGCEIEIAELLGAFLYFHDFLFLNRFLDIAVVDVFDLRAIFGYAQCFGSDIRVYQIVNFKRIGSHQKLY